MIIGSELSEFINRQTIDEKSKQLLLNNTEKILSRTELLNGGTANHCQLVVGEVQSGKTMSFTSLIAAAHDNDFPLVIVLAGTKDNLLFQTSERLQRDLQTYGNGGANPWQVIIKPGKGNFSDNLTKLKKSLKNWNDKSAPIDFKPTTIITTLKNRNGMDSIANLVNELKSTIDLDNFPVLIVDDEGDEAGLNLEHAADGESTIYASINRLRKSFRRHSYVMYTATPQGPLVVKIQDSLSPKFVTLLKSGPDYVGGEELFQDQNSFFFKEIPQSESTLIANPSRNDPIPGSLKQALAYFILAFYVAQKRKNPRPISMLIHPSVKKDHHEVHKEWVDSTLLTWERIFNNPNESAFSEEIQKYFEPAFRELKTTVNLDQTWDLNSILSKDIKWWLSNIEVRIINSDRNDIRPEEWMSKSGWILIGGNKLSRGYTIENLTVTYMPRSIGVGNADVIQQRGRFFGYKRKYKDLLRGWFFREHIEAYSHYADHDRIMRKELSELDASHLELATWRRKFLLDPAYQLVRSQVISLDITRRRIANFKQQQLFDINLGKETNRVLSSVLNLISSPTKFETDNRVGTYNNYHQEIEVNQLLNLLADWPMSAANRAELDDIIWAVSAFNGRGTVNSAHLVLMDFDIKSNTFFSRTRSLLHNSPQENMDKSEQSIANLFQGRDSKIAKHYPGDDQMFIKDSITLQVHKISPNYAGEVMPSVAALALIFPGNVPTLISQI